MGDVLEHVINPIQVISEMGRIAKKVVMTVFKEWRLKEANAEGNVERANQQMREGLKKMGGHDSIDDYFKSLPWMKEKLLDLYPDEKVSHHPHLWEFTENRLLEILKEANMDIIIMREYMEGYDNTEFMGSVSNQPFYNWLIICQKLKEVM